MYLFESELPGNKSIYFALTNVLGMGYSKAGLICKKSGFSKNFKIQDLNKDQILELTSLVESQNFVLQGNLKKSKSLNLKRLVFIKSYRGLRLKQGLPVRGQRTHTNARTAKKRL